MDGFIDRLADFLRSVLGDNGEASEGNASDGPRGSSRARSARYADPDLESAWEELDEYMRTGTERERPAGHDGGSARTRRPVDESLRQDYANLEVPFGSDIETVRASYKRLIMHYHPDKQAGDPEKQKVALEITKKINESFDRIRRAQQ